MFKRGDWCTNYWQLPFKFRIGSVPHTAKFKQSRRAMTPRKRFFKELDELVLPFVRTKRRQGLINIINAWRWDVEILPSNHKDRNWKQYSKKKKQWM